MLSIFQDDLVADTNVQNWQTPEKNIILIGDPNSYGFSHFKL